MSQRTQRLLSWSLATVYAVLALFGNALHQHAFPQDAAGADASCGHCCCCCVNSDTQKTAPASESAGWDGANPPTGHDSDNCLACQALAQLALGKASPPAILPRAWTDLPLRVVSDDGPPSSRLSTQSARGPPSLLATV